MTDLPYPVFDAIHMALSFLSFEDLPTEDRPARHIWLNPDAMDEHWEMVKRRREDRYKSGGSTYAEDDDIDDPVQSDLTDGLRERLMSG